MTLELGVRINVPFLHPWWNAGLAEYHASLVQATTATMSTWKQQPCPVHRTVVPTNLQLFQSFGSLFCKVFSALRGRICKTWCVIYGWAIHRHVFSAFWPVVILYDHQLLCLLSKIKVGSSLGHINTLAMGSWSYFTKPGMNFFLWYGP